MRVRVSVRIRGRGRGRSKSGVRVRVREPGDAVDAAHARAHEHGGRHEPHARLRLEPQEVVEARVPVDGATAHAPGARGAPAAGEGRGAVQLPLLARAALRARRLQRRSRRAVQLRALLEQPQRDRRRLGPGHSDHGGGRERGGAEARVGVHELGEQRLLGAPAQQRRPARRAPRRAARREQRVDCGLAEREVRARDEAAVGLGALRLERREQRGGAERGQPREQAVHQRRARLRLHERAEQRRAPRLLLEAERAVGGVHAEGRELDVLRGARLDT